MSEHEQARVVVVGGTGNIGTSVVEALATDSRVSEILVLSRRKPLLAEPKARWLATDVCEADLVERFRGADAVVHLAWLFQPTHDPLTTWRTNVLGSLRVLQSVASAGVRTLVYASSVGAYSPRTGPEPVDERWPTNGWPTAAYTREKAYLERCLDYFEREHPAIRVVRMRTAFSFKRESASEQRRLFLGPFLPNRLINPERLPVLPDLPGLRFQTAHSADIGEAYRLATLSGAFGAFNVAADPVLTTDVLADLFDARPISLPIWPVRSLLAAAWGAHLVPASPELFDAFLRLPMMNTSRARDVLGWRPRYSATDAVQAFLGGLRAGDGMATPPLRPKVSGGRLHEIRTGVGQRP